MSTTGKKRPASLPDSLTIVLTGTDLAHLDAYRQAEHDVSYPPVGVQQGNTGQRTRLSASSAVTRLYVVF